MMLEIDDDEKEEEEEKKEEDKGRSYSHQSHKIYICSLQQSKIKQKLSTTAHATTKLFVPFCSTQDGESTQLI